MGEHGGQVDHAGCWIDGGCLHRCDLVLAERLAHDIEPAREWCIAESAFGFSGTAGADDGHERLFWVDEGGLRLGKRRGECCDCLTRPGHGPPPSREGQSSLRLPWSVWPAPRDRSLLWRLRASMI